jgi:phosphatidylglycerol:prolipoprotein diacylglycerol transferase
MLPILQVGPLAVPVPGLVLLAAFWIGASLAERRAARYQVDPEQVGNLLFYGLLAGILGARLGYALLYPNAFLQSPGSLLSLDSNLLDPASGLLVALLFGLIYAQRQDMALWPTLDALTPFLAVMAVALALANLASGQAYGLPSELPWTIELWGARRHPVQLYQALAAGAILWTVLRAPAQLRAGSTFLRFTLLSASARLLLEAFRADGAVLPNGWRLAQIGAWLVLALVVWQLHRHENAVSER